MTFRDPGPGGAIGKPGRRPGDRRLRVDLVTARDYRVRAARRVRRPPSAAVVLIAGFALLIAVGTAFLLLPVSAASGRSAEPLVALFTATSAVCVTGLVVVDTGTFWSPFGQAVILALIQVGGFGFMTGSTLLLVVLLGGRTGLRDRVLAQASTGTPTLGSVTSLIRRMAGFTLAVEAAGALILGLAFLARGEEPVRALTSGAFHAISAFNNAGLDIMGDFRSFSDYARDPFILVVVAALLILGGLGFAIIGDITAGRRWSRWSLESKVVVLTSAALLVGGTLVLGGLEWSNRATLGNLPPGDRIVNAFFASASTRSAGFNALPMTGFLEVSLVVMIALMFIGGASGSTAGGIKVNTFSLLLIAIVSTARGNPSATAFGRRIPHIVIYRALAVALLSIAVAFGVGLGLELMAEGTLIDRAFEAVSALGTVGLTTGITPSLPDPARLLIIVAMFAGRLGPLTLVLALTARARSVSYRHAVETMRIG